MIPTTTSNIVNTNASNLQQFTIADSGMLIDLLSTKLYTDKLGSFVREISTNALDANIAANNQSIPIQIDVSVIEGILTVSITDRGLGMSPELVRSKLAVLGESTKDSDNVAHGGFGVGFLTTLAVSRKIEIISCHAGTCYHYQICEQPGQRIGIFLLSSVPCSTTGTTVKVWLNRDYTIDQLDQAGDDLDRALRKLVYTLPVKPLMNCDDWQVFSAAKLARSIDQFLAQKICGDHDYTFYLQSDSYVRNDLGLNLQRYSDTTRVLRVMLGSVAYSPSRELIRKGLNDYLGESNLGTWDARRVKTEVETRISNFCEGCKALSYSGKHTESDNVLVLHFEIGELEVVSSRESLASSAANATKIFAKLQVAFERLRAEIAQKLTHSIATPGIFGDRIGDYISAAQSWGIDKITVEGVPLDLDQSSDKATWSCQTTWFSYWHAQQRPPSKSQVKDPVFQQQDWFTTSETKNSLLLEIILKISRVGRPQVVILTGMAADKSVLRLFKKAQKDHPEIDPTRVIVLDERPLSSLDSLLADLPWLPSFADIHQIETSAPRRNTPTFNTGTSSTLIWLALKERQTDPVFSGFEWHNKRTDAPHLPRLNFTKFAAQTSIDAPVYYVNSRNFCKDKLARLIKAIDLFGFDLPGVYLVGERAVKDLTDTDYNLVEVWELIYPLVSRWMQKSLSSVVAKIGFAPGCSRYSHGSEILRLRIAFLRKPQVRKFVSPDKLWLIDWLVKNAELSEFVLTQLSYKTTGTKAENKCIELSQTMYEEANPIKKQGWDRGDTHLAFTLRYIFEDVLTDLPVLTRLNGVFSPIPAGEETEQLAISAVLADIKHGSLRQWHQRKYGN